jgi:serine/threonine-protein kinase PknG
MNKCASCGGTIEDGYCTVCGLAAAPAAVPSSSAPSFPSTSGGSSASGSSSGSLVSGSPSTTSGGSTRSGSRRGSRRSSGRSSRGRLGAGLVEIPPVPYRDPSTAVLANPQVPENRRYCGNCGHEVGRGRDGRAGLAEGFCRNCGTRFSFTPKLVAGDLVGGQYEVLGCLAFGGLGWIYLARDHNVSDRWVVLKGLLNTGDPDAMEAAVAERQFLAQVEHPNIVRIYNFVQHGDAGYIVMEYVGGKSLKDIRRPGPVPVSHALAYAIEVLPALGYLHDRGLVYCDFKPDNVIQTEEQLKLIDMGGVRAIDGDGAIYGTVGYQAPEIETEGPSVSSDLFTIGRALAVLTFDFHGYQTTYKYTLPGDIPLLAEQESFARLLRRATSADPDRRFDSAGEMAEQLTGVLREVLSVADGKPRPAFSNVFSPELAGIGTGHESQPAVTDGAAAALPRPGPAEVISGLPMPQVDRTSPAAGFLATFAGLDPVQRAAALTRAVAGDGVPPEVATSAETGLALVRALLDSGDAEAAGGVLADLAARDPLDWRIAWYDGLRRLATGAAAGGTGQSSAAAAASGAFSAVYDELPGELAPKLALGFAAEAAGDAAEAGRYFRLVWTVDKSYISAAFGLARACLAAGDRPTAIAALAAVPETSSHHAAAQIAAVRILVSPGVSGDDLRAADSRLGRLALDEGRRQQLTIEILRAALDWASASRGGSGRRSAGAAAAGPGQSNAAAAGPGQSNAAAAGPGQSGAAAVGPGQSNTAVAGGGKILGYEPNERALRFGLEQGYRALARLTPDRERRIELVDLANEVRPRTWT